MKLNRGDRLPAELAAAPRPGARYRIFYFLRTADCPVCRNHVKRLAELAPSLAELGADVTVLAPDGEAPAWAAGLPHPVLTGEAAYLAAGFGRTLGAIQQSGTIVASGDGVILDVRRATLPFQAFDERALLALLQRSPRTEAA